MQIKGRNSRSAVFPPNLESLCGRSTPRRGGRWSKSHLSFLSFLDICQSIFLLCLDGLTSPSPSTAFVFLPCLIFSTCGCRRARLRLLVLQHDAEAENCRACAQWSALDRVLVRLSESCSICSEFFCHRLKDDHRTVKDRLCHLMPESSRTEAIELSLP